MSAKEISKELAQFVIKTDFDQFPIHVVEKAKECFLDWLGCAFYGSSSESAKMFIELAQELDGVKESTIIGHGRTSCLNGALVNGAASHEIEFDDAHQASISHPGVAVIPSALAIAERKHVSGKTFLASIILGYDVALRIGTAVSPSHYTYWHTTGTCGTFGAAAAAGKILGLDENKMLDALGNAGTQAAGLWEFSNDGAMTKVLHPGKAAMNGLLSALLAEKGFTGATRILEGEKGFCRATSSQCDLDSLVDGLGQDFKIMEVWLKVFPCCGHAHTSVTAILELVNKFQLNPGEISKITVHTNPIANRIAGTRSPRSVRQAKFSIPFCLAAAVMNQRLSLDEFTPEMLDDSRVRFLMDTVKLQIDHKIDPDDPYLWLANVQIALNNGQLLEASSNYPPGTPRNPMKPSQVIDKFKHLSSKNLSQSQIEKLVHQVQRLEEINDMADLLLGW